MARAGRPAENVGRALSAGVGYHHRTLSSRTTQQELWTPLRMLLTPEVGVARLQGLWGHSFDGAAHRRFIAYVTQAESFYLSAEGMAPESRPLVAYYFVLNLTKAYLTCVAPSVTEKRLFHGLGDAFDAKQRYWFIHEQTKVARDGIFRELATRTGAAYCYPNGHLLTIQRLAPYLAETADIFEDATGDALRLVPLAAVAVLSDGSDAWLRVEVERGELRRRAIGPAALPQRAHLFGEVFRHVQSETASASYESEALSYGGRRILTRADDLAELFNRALIHSNRGTTGPRHLAVISDRAQLLSQEAVTFAVIHHLSNMVRYRPEQVAKLSEGKWFFLFDTWVPRAIENYLLTMTSRVLREEVRIA
jgi:hypothetical protein